jgi:hypothetical protein
MKSQSFDIVAGSPADDIFCSLEKRHKMALAEADKIALEHGVLACEVVTDGRVIIGFRSIPESMTGAVIDSKALRFNDALGCMVPTLGTPEGVRLHTRLAAIKLVAPLDITKAFGGKPVIDKSTEKLHFVAYRRIGIHRLLTVPEGSIENLPEGLKLVGHVHVS